MAPLTPGKKQRSGNSLSGGSLRPNDDNAERQKSRAFVDSPMTPEKLSGSQDSTAKLPPAQIANLYTNCIKLCTENKINAKNTWNLQLIDYMSDFLRGTSASNGDDTNFQAASCGLDASVKIYSYRVDSVHTDAYKMLGGLSRSRKQDGGDNGSDLPAEDDDENTTGRRTKQRRCESTLESNPANLTLRNAELASQFPYSADPLFKKTSAVFDEGGAKGLLLSNIGVHGACELMVSSDDPYDVVTVRESSDNSEDASDDEMTCDLSSLSGWAKELSTTLNKDQVCPVFSQWATEKNDETSNPVEDEGAAADVPLFPCDDDGFPCDDDGDSMVDDDNGPMPYDEDDNADGEKANEMLFRAFSNVEETGMSDPVRMGTLRGTDAAIGMSQFEYILSLAGSDDLIGDACSYLDRNRIKRWASKNAGHWKFGRQGSEEPSGAAPAKKRTSKKEPFKIDFSDLPAYDDPLYKKVFDAGRTRNTLTAAALAKLDAEANRLPPVNVKVDPRELTSLFLKPHLSVRRVVGSSAEADDNDANRLSGAYALHANDIDDDDHDDGGDFENHGMDMHDPEDPHFDDFTSAGDNASSFLVSEPTRVAKIELSYARRDKNVDVKALKQRLWRPLSELEKPKKENSGKENVENCSVSGTPTKGTPGKPPNAKQSESFQSLMRAVAGEMHAEEIQDVSVPICFICLLHLANEETLSISGAASLDTLNIARG